MAAPHKQIGPKAATEMAKEFLCKLLDLDAEENVSIGFWPRSWPAKKNGRHPSVGVRVTWISWRPKGAEKKSELNQKEAPIGLAACAQTERLILAYAEHWPVDQLRREQTLMATILFGVSPTETTKARIAQVCTGRRS